MGFDEIVGKLKDFYYFFEDRYYEFLDKVNEKVPVYKVIDPIDRVFPSFVIFILLLLLIFLFLVLLIFGGKGGPLEPLANAIWSLVSSVLSLFGLLKSSAAKFIVIDNDNNPISNAEVAIEAGKDIETISTNYFGEAKFSLFAEKAKVTVKAQGFKPFESEMKLEAGKLYKITLEKTVSSTPKQIIFELRDERGLISTANQVSISFSCSNQRYAPANISGKGPSHKVNVQSACGTLVATINASGYEEARKSVDLATTQGTIIVNLRKELLFADVRVVVKDYDTSEPINGVFLTFLKGGLIAFQGGTTDSSGSKIVNNIGAGDYVIEARPPAGSSYETAYSDEFTIGSAQFSSTQPFSVEIRMRKTQTVKAIILKFVDESNNNAISNVTAKLIANNRQSVSLNSNSEGLVEFENLGLAENAYSVVASHPDYVLKVITGLKFSKNNEHTLVKLQKASNSNSGKAKVFVTEYLGNEVQNASVFLYMNNLPYPINDGLTNSNGIAEFSNLPAGAYKAKAIKEINGKEYSNFSGERTLRNGQEIQLDIVLVMSNGFVEVKVIDNENRPIQDAVVSFVENGKELAKERTNSQGKTPRMEFSVDKQPIIVVSKEGYYTTSTPKIKILPGATKSVEVELRRISQNNDFKPAQLLLSGVFDSSGRTVSKFEDNKEYVFKFELIVHNEDNAEPDVTALIRSGLETQLNANSSTIVIKKVETPNLNVVYYSCFNPQNNYAECSPAEGDAKQVLVSLNSAGTGNYILYVTTFIKEVEDNKENDTDIEIRYGAKTKKGSVETYKPERNSLYVWSAKLNSTFCISNCGFSISAEIMSSSQNGNIPNWINALEGTIELIEGQEYKIRVKAHNLTDKSFENERISFTTDPVMNPPAIQLGQTSLSIGNFSPKQVFTGENSIRVLKSVNSLKLKMALNTKEKGNEAESILRITALKPLVLTLDRETLIPEKENQIVIAKVLDNSSIEIEDAQIEVFENEERLNLGGQTDSRGIYSINFRQGYEASTVFEIVASKTGYVNAEKQLIVRDAELQDQPKPFLDCVKVHNKPPWETEIELNSRSCNGVNCTAQPINLQVKNECDEAVEINISKARESDLSFTPNNFTLSTGGTSTITVSQGKQLGVHPLYFKAKKGNVEFDLGFVLAVVTSPNSCLELKKVVGNETTSRILLDFQQSTEFLKFINKCYTGFSDEDNPKTDFGSNAINESLYFNMSREIKNTNNYYSEQTYEVKPIRVTNSFFLVSVNDFKK